MLLAGGFDVDAGQPVRTGDPPRVGSQTTSILPDRTGESRKTGSPAGTRTRVSGLKDQMSFQ